jgi:hypothetical protein
MQNTTFKLDTKAYPPGTIIWGWDLRDRRRQFRVVEGGGLEPVRKLKGELVIEPIFISGPCPWGAKLRQKALREMERLSRQALAGSNAKPSEAVR